MQFVFYSCFLRTFIGICHYYSHLSIGTLKGAPYFAARSPLLNSPAWIGPKGSGSRRWMDGCRGARSKSKKNNFWSPCEQALWFAYRISCRPPRSGRPFEPQAGPRRLVVAAPPPKDATCRSRACHCHIPRKAPSLHAFDLCVTEIAAEDMWAPIWQFQVGG